MRINIFKTLFIISFAFILSAVRGALTYLLKKMDRTPPAPERSEESKQREPPHGRPLAKNRI